MLTSETNAGVLTPDTNADINAQVNGKDFQQIDTHSLGAGDARVFSGLEIVSLIYKLNHNDPTLLYLRHHIYQG